MTTNRREFLERVGATAMLGALPLSALSPLARTVPETTAPAEEWDFKWTAALKGKKHKAVFDCAEVESGYGVWRASFWERHYQEALSAKPADIATVLVLRHNALVLAFQQPLWDSAAIGDAQKVTHPVTQQGTTKNPALLTAARQEVPEMFDWLALPKFIQRGGIVLACNLALQFFAGGLAQKAGITPEEARKRAIDAFVPGVILMPSGVFACVKAQEEGCHYVMAS